MVIALAIGPFVFVNDTEGDETDRGFLLCRLVWSTDSDLVFVRGRRSLRWLASQKKNVAAWNSFGARTVSYVDGKGLFERVILNSISWWIICIPASAPYV